MAPEEPFIWLGRRPPHRGRWYHRPVKRTLVWVWIVFTGLVTLAALVATVMVLVRGGGVGAIIPGAAVLGFGWSCFESARRRRFRFFFFEM
jgi:hypothetical protein